MGSMSPTPPPSNSTTSSCSTASGSPTIPETSNGRQAIQPWLTSYLEFAAHPPNWTPCPPSMAYHYLPPNEIKPHEWKIPEWSTPTWAHNIKSAMSEPIALIRRESIPNNSKLSLSLKSTPPSRSVSPCG